jgi:hypothetical protein
MCCYDPVMTLVFEVDLAVMNMYLIMAVFNGFTIPSQTANSIKEPAARSPATDPRNIEHWLQKNQVANQVFSNEKPGMETSLSAFKQACHWHDKGIKSCPALPTCISQKQKSLSHQLHRSTHRRRQTTSNAPGFVE